MSKTLRAFAKQAEYTHATSAETAGVNRGWIHLYTVDQCEVCGDEVLGANAVMVRATTAEAEAAGLIVKVAPSDEGGWSDIHGCATCTACCYDPNARNAHQAVS